MDQNLRESIKATGCCDEDWLVSQGRPVGHRTPAELGWQPGVGHYEVAVVSRGRGGGFGGPGRGVRERLEEMLSEGGVPEEVASARAAAAMSAMGGKSGLQKVLEGADSEEHWRRLKRRADEEGPRRVLKIERRLSAKDR